MQLIPIPFLAVTVTVLVWAEYRGAQRVIYVAKPLSTLLVIVVALFSLAQPDARPAFTWWVTAGLVLSLGGDVALMFKTDRAFLAGLVLFLLAHVVYAIGFTLPNGFYAQDLISAGVLLAIAVAVYAYLKPGLGGMKGPVIFYIAVICVMVNRAVSTFYGDYFSQTQAWLLTLGASLFWLSDLVLAVNRFRRPFEANRLSLFLYFGGQLLIALSPSYFGG
jgi:uncharacterized membrane protein YhhN